MNKAYAVAFTANDQVELTSFELPDLQAGEVLIRTEVSGVSPGTEMRCLATRISGLSLRSWILDGRRRRGSG